MGSLQALGQVYEFFLLGGEFSVALFELLKLVHLPVELLPLKCEALVLLAQNDEVRLQLNQFLCGPLKTEVLVGILAVQVLDSSLELLEVLRELLLRVSLIL